MRIENAGILFYLSKKTKLRKESKEKIKESLKHLPPQHGDNIVYSSDSNYFWAYFKPASKIFPNQNFYSDDDNLIILFTGLIYSSHSDEQIKVRLQTIRNSSDIKKLLNEISGSYCGILYNKKGNKGWAFTDNTGIQKLFYVNDADSLVFCSNLAVLKTVKDKNEFSSFALSSLLYASFTYKNTVIRGIGQVNPACFMEFNHTAINEEECQEYPERRNLSLKQSLELIDSAQKSFWQRVGSKIDNDNILCLSRGKDSRIILKHMIKNSCYPYVITYFRRNNPIYPLITFNLDDTYDCQAAIDLSEKNKISFRCEKIDNIYLLENLKEILMLNHGTPLHWELHAVSRKFAGIRKYILTGFLGETIAGKCYHNYYFKKLKGHEDYGKLDFSISGDAVSYNKIKNILDGAGIKLADTEELEKIWIEQFKIGKTDNLNNIFQMGYLRTRAMGRTVSTFNQSRMYTVPIYPFIDNSIRESYMSIPDKFLKWGKIHLMQVSRDKNMNFIPTTRLQVNARWEERILEVSGLLRKLEKSLIEIKASNYKKRPDIESALLRSLEEFPEFPSSAVKKFFETGNTTDEDYNILLNMLNALRIEKYYVKYKPGLRSNLNFIQYGHNHKFA
jgi:hypothetical protein